MKNELMKILACPVCKGGLTLTATEEKVGEIIAGQISCLTCQKVYPISGGIPNLIPSNSSALAASTTVPADLKKA